PERIGMWSQNLLSAGCVSVINMLCCCTTDGRPYAFPSDVWSFGLSILTCALGRLPIDSSGGYWSILQSIRDDVGPRVPNDGRWSDEFVDFIHQTLKKNPEERPTCEQLLQHPFLKVSGTGVLYWR